MCLVLLTSCFYSENAGLLALTRVGSRRVVQISAGFMLFFSVLGMLFQLADLELEEGSQLDLILLYFIN